MLALIISIELGYKCESVCNTPDSLPQTTRGFLNY
jgi:hypothetical protein